MKSRQRWALAATGLFVGYVLSPVLVLWMAERLGGVGVRRCLALTIYLPIVALCRLMPSLEDDFYAWQDEWLRSVIGEP